MKLEPTEAQRKAMAEVGASGPTAGWSDRVNDWFPVVHRMIAAANSIPEGPPVGTIARRPDGEWIAWRTEDGWGYRFIGDEEPNEWPPGSSIADFWPVIYDPTDHPSREELREYFHKDLAEHCQADDPDEYPDEYHEGDKPRLERLMREPSVFEAHLTKLEVIEVLDALGRLDGTVKSAVRLLTGFSDERLEELGGFSDTTAQQEPCCGVSEVYDCDCPPAIRITPKPRTPRVVDRLGVDEQGSRWRNRADTEFWFQDECWNFRTRDGQTSSFGSGYEPRVGIFTEVLS